MPARILMCPPDHFGIEYEINPWMSRDRQSDRMEAARQWQSLRGLLEASGAAISLLPPVEGLPDLVFTANAALIFRDRAVLSHFKHEVREREAPYDEAWLAQNGFTVLHVPPDVYFEGAGDALFCGDTLFAGYRIRSDARGHQQIGRLLDCRVIPLELVDPYYYHLDTCFCPLAPGIAVYYPPAFDYRRSSFLKNRHDALNMCLTLAPGDYQNYVFKAGSCRHVIVSSEGGPRYEQNLRHETSFTQNARLFGDDGFECLCQWARHREASNCVAPGRNLPSTARRFGSF